MSLRLLILSAISAVFAVPCAPLLPAQTSPPAAQTVHAPCSAESFINDASLSTLRPELARIDALQTKADLGGYLAHAQLAGIHPFFVFSSMPDPQDATKSLPLLARGGLGLPHSENYLGTGAQNQQHRAQYVTSIAQSFIRAGQTPPQAQADATTVLQLETALARISVSAQAFHRMPRGDLKKLAPLIDWDIFLADYGPPPSPYLDIEDPEFLIGVNTVLKHEDMPQLRAYLRWHLLLHSYKCDAPQGAQPPLIPSQPFCRSRGPR